jgi:hypothetical protein
MRAAHDGYSVGMADQHRYRIEDGQHCVDIRLNTVEQLFDNRDPAPFRERDLDPDLVEYLVGAAEDLVALGKFKVIFWIAQPCAPAEVQTGYRAHFEYELERVARRSRRQRRTGQIALVLGLVLLVALLSLSELLDGSSSRVVRALREGLAILSWVVMWRPVEALIYDWLPIRRESKIMRRLHDAPTEVRPGKGP